MSDASSNLDPIRRDPFRRAYQSLRQDLVTGHVHPGDQIVVVELAKRLGISPTPVREALARLAGERLVEDRRRHGYFVPLLSSFDLTELYDLCELYVGAAVDEARRRGEAAEIGQPRHAENAFGPDSFANVLAALLGLSPSARLVSAGRACLECLSAAGRAEAMLFGGEEAGLGLLGELAAAGAWGEAMRELRRVLRVRRSRAEPVARAMATAFRARNRANIV